MRALSRREEFIRQCLLMLQAGLPYLWDGKGQPGGWGWNDTPSAAEPYDGRDCSGFVTSALVRAGGPDLRLSTSSSAMFAEFRSIITPSPGDLAFWPGHVMVVLGVGPLLIGSAGGDRSTVSLAAVEAQRAKGVECGAQVWPSTDFMPGFLGCRAIPWLDQS